MVSITIRDVPQEVRDELASRAAASGRSLQEYLAQALDDLAAKPSLEALLVDVRRNALRFPVLEVDSLTADLAADRR
ncbi:hypothetical protein NKG05_10805 [Oerskovia sp. M15]